ncbi:hypothetical protein DPQ33_13320 [Oceanidesulfovibrio indonesiensis]|uniref:histidine kinase n=1 Tax=Oceanidesulfovibrio indonesiensis TaxID=54767 RepID=A0A7M3MC57_9BACT|nr:HAMP domain-containing sensor histidine kinase [Oceanidesulfovibrio indonesiensis]TVM15944.1 hypothetical protein DPQ33_13320 [Oceanidesulfovibrio indonesiensis]
MRVWLLRVLVFLLITLGAAVISIVVYDHAVNQKDMFRFRALHRSEVLKNVGRLLLEWRRNGAEAATREYLDEQRKLGRIYTLLDSKGTVLAGAQLNEDLRDLARRAMDNDGYAIPETAHDFFAPPMRPPSMEAFVFRGRDKAEYVLALTNKAKETPPPGKPKPLVFIVLGACVAAFVLYALFRISTTATRELRAAMRLLGQGDFGVRVDSALERRNDTFSKLARDFNATVTSLAGKQAEQRYMIADLAHDMRSSLTRMALAMELASNTSPDKAARLQSRIKADSDKLNTISEQLMHHVRQQWNEARRIPLRLAVVLRSLARELDTQAREQGKRVVFVHRGGCRVLGNEPQIASMVRNIAANALRHSPASGEVRIFLERDAEAGAARIVIEDDGPGLPQEMLREVFEPFRQGENSGESGLGLAIAKLVCERHGGSITLDNRPERGLRATILLPLMYLERAEQSIDSEPQSETAAWAGAEQ